MAITSRIRSSRHGTTAMAASAAVLCMAVGFYGYAIRLEGSQNGPTYELRATFLSSNGLHQGADVMLGGVVVGKVTVVALDPRTLASEVTFRIDQALKLPADTRLSIGSSTLTSGEALLVDPGHSHHTLPSGAVLADTCEPTNLEQQVSRYIFGSGGAASGC